MRFLFSSCFTVAFGLGLGAGCGARTGLDAPPPRDGGAPDSFRLDAAVPIDVGIDTGLDAGPPECSTSSECDDGVSCTDERCVDQRCVREPHDDRCDDGLFCTGVEVCSAFGGCSSAPPVCADSVECTFDHCDEDVNACVFDPDATRCPISHRCDVVRGCAARALAHDRDGVLTEIDLPEGTINTLGVLPFPLTDIALAPDGTLYGAVPGELHRIDYMAGTSARIGEVPGRFVALDVAPDGRFYGASDDLVYRLDVVTGTRTEVARLPAGYQASGDVAFVDGALLATALLVRDMSRDDVLIHIPLDGSPSELIGSLGQRCVWGLAPFGSLLYGLTCEGELLSIDPTSGASRVLATPGPEFYGAASR